jgi:GntR family histidine utilization transcriptional repressor
MTRKTSAESHHARIIASLRQAIVEGSLAPGHLLPRETDLAAEYGVSRMTMNKVLTQLTAEGYLVRRKRSGTFVAEPRGQAAVMEINDIEQEVTGLGLSYSWSLASAQVSLPDEKERVLLDLPRGVEGKLLMVSGLHMARGRPFCMETRAINLDAVPQASAQDFSRTAPGQWLVRTMPFSAASHRIRAVSATGADARRLGVAGGAACLEILRKTRIDQTWVTHVRLLYPGALHQVVADFAPRGAGVPPAAA